MIRKIGCRVVRGLDAIELEVFLGIVALIVVVLLAIPLVALVWRFA
jgi:hypothetical protein